MATQGPFKQTRLFLEPLAGARERLWEVVASFKRGDPLAPVTVVGPGSYALLSLRHALGRHGMANVRFMALPRLSELLGAPSLAKESRRPLTPLLESAAVTTVAEAADGPLWELRQHQAMRRSLKATFRQLRHASPQALKRLEESGPVRLEVMRLHQRFRERTSTYYDREDLAGAAARSVQGGVSPALRDLGPIVFYLVRRLTPAERALAETIAIQWESAVILGLTGEPEVDASARSLSTRLGPALGPPQEAAAERLAPARLVVAPDSQQEVRWAVRRIMKSAQDGVAFHRTAILYRQALPYATLIREELELASLPVAGPGALLLSGTAVGRSLLGLIGLADGEMERDVVMDWLTSCPVRPPGVAGQRFSAAQWDTVSRRAGVVRGIDQWRERLARHADERERLAERAGALEGISEAAQVRFREEARAARSLAEFVVTLEAETRPPPDGSRWEKFVIWARRLLDRFVDRTADLPALEADAQQRITDRLHELEGIDDLEPGTSFARFSQALEEALEETVGHVGQTGQGVFVAPLGTAAGMDFDVVHVVGMVEGAMPPRAGDDPLLPDRDRELAGGPEEGLPLQRARPAEERYDYLAALATGSRLVLSFPRADFGAQRGQYPSRWFLEQAAALEGSPVHASTLPSMSSRPWLTILESMEEALDDASHEALADLHDYDLERVWRWRRVGLPVASHPLAESSPLGRALAMGWRRQSNELSEWDGDLSALAAGATRLNVTTRRVVSATSLQSWATCPFQYFLGRVLGIASLERPEEVATISPLEKGSLVHGILEEFMGAVKGAGGVPEPHQPWRDEHLTLLHRVARDAFRRAESQGVTGKPLLWELVQEDILSDLDTFLEEDSRLRRRFGLSPVVAEASFGMDRNADALSWPAASYEAPGVGRVRFHGAIDRVDADPSRRDAMVLDYKTGESSYYRSLRNDLVDRGRRLQLPVYALALRGAFGEGVRVRAAYWFVSARGKFMLLPPDPADLDDMSGPFESALTTIVGGIRQGLFPANPGKETQGSYESCRRCDFDTLCPTRRDDFWRRKREDRRLEAYLSLSEGEGAED